MRRKCILLFLMLSAAFSGLLAQRPVLLMHNVKNGKEKVVRQADMIRVKDREGNTYKGRMAIVNDSLLVIGASGIAIQDVVEVRKVTLAAKILGGLLAGTAGLATAYGAYGIIVLISEGGFAMVFAIILAVPVAIAAILTGTGLLIMNSGRRYKNSKWNFSIAPGPSETEPAGSR